MNDQTNARRNFAPMLLAGVLALVIGGVLVIAATHSRGGSAGPPAAASAALAGAADGTVYFAPGADALPAEASPIIVRVADAARAQHGTQVLISGFHDASGDAAANAELAKRRALAVRHALEANGVAPDRLVLDRPAVAGGEADAREAGRVEMRLR